MCGGTRCSNRPCRCHTGLSPRVRGNRTCYIRHEFLLGSIPACAGEPERLERYDRLVRVYPRVCGGTTGTGSTLVSFKGLSPRVRGNRVASYGSVDFSGSIPACAGEPDVVIALVDVIRVYPRVCGGTTGTGSTLVSFKGLSPRVRGNRVASYGSVDFSGSIPACAGEPDVVIALVDVIRVYPRVCGGTMKISTPEYSKLGLSPRVRGNHNYVLGDRIPNGSIPACAGEPDNPGVCCNLNRVYPRVCGGTGQPWRMLQPEPGLSPRVRGNLQTHTQQSYLQGSIPACAGEPRSF